MARRATVFTAPQESYRSEGERERRRLAAVEARKDAELDDEKLEELALIASGGGRVDATMRAIAAWLWLKKTGGQDRALARIVGEA